MPELPEAETIARGLEQVVPGRSIRTVEVIRPDVIEGPQPAFSAAVRSCRIRKVGRRGKNLVLTLESPSPSLVRLRLVVNLGMSGRLLLGREGHAAPVVTHPAVRFHLDDDSVLVYHDVRRFGRLAAISEEAYGEWSRRLGPEPLSPAFDPASLMDSLQRSRSPIRSWLLDQAKVAGIGNIYANEALWHAGIHPRSPASDIRGESVVRLHGAIRRVLTDAIDAGGTTLKDYRTADGWRGSYGGSLRVYGREGLPCPECDTPIERGVLSGRSTFFCPRCQPPPGG